MEHLIWMETHAQSTGRKRVTKDTGELGLVPALQKMGLARKKTAWNN